MGKSLRDILEDEIKKTESEIKKSLQRFHDATGMLPRSISFANMDIKTWDTDEPRKAILVENVRLEAST